MTYTFSDKISGVKPSAIREILKLSADRSVISFSAGNPAAEAFPVEAVRAITDRILAEDPILALQYSVTEGYPPLRQALEGMCRTRYHVLGEEDEVIVVSGAQQGLELCCKVLCNEGDTILCEDPSFVGALNAFRSYGVHLVGIPLEEDGLSLKQLEEALQKNDRVRALYIIPNFQNPSGVTTSMEKRRAVYDLCTRHNVVILEDNPYGELRFEGEDIPSIKTLDTQGSVIYCGSFSKVLSPGLRVGYVVANRAIIAKMVVAKQSSDVHTAILSQIICERFLATCDFDKHVAGLRALYKGKSALMINAMREHFSPRVTYLCPQGGLFMWCTLPQGSDMPAFCHKAVAEYKVAVVPGTAFTATEGDATTAFRVNFATPSDDEIRKGIAILGALTKEFVR